MSAILQEEPLDTNLLEDSRIGINEPITQKHIVAKPKIYFDILVKYITLLLQEQSVEILYLVVLIEITTITFEKLLAKSLLDIPPLTYLLLTPNIITIMIITLNQNIISIGKTP